MESHRWDGMCETISKSIGLRKLLEGPATFLLGNAYHLEQTYVGYQFCVSNPGGNWVNPNPLNVTSATVGRYS